MYNYIVAGFGWVWFLRPLWRSDVFAEVSRGRGQCPLSGVGRCPPLGGFLSTSSTRMSIGGTKLVCCREVVRFSEGSLLEVLLYFNT